MKKVLSLLLVLGLCFGLAGCGGDDSGSDDKKTEQKEEKKDTYAVGETAEVEGIKITVNSTRVDEGIVPANEGKQYFVMDISLENTKDDEFSSSSILCYELKDGEGRKAEMSVAANLNGNLDTTVAPGEKVAGEIAFETAIEGELVLKFTPSIGSDSVKIKVR